MYGSCELKVGDTCHLYNPTARKHYTAVAQRYTSPPGFFESISEAAEFEGVGLRPLRVLTKFMEEAHIHAAASLLARTIMVYDDRQRTEGQPRILMRYEPGYVSTATVVKKKGALRMLERGSAVLWIHLTTTTTTMNM